MGSRAYVAAMAMASAFAQNTLGFFLLDHGLQKKLAGDGRRSKPSTSSNERLVRNARKNVVVKLTTNVVEILTTSFDIAGMPAGFYVVAKCALDSTM